MSRTCRPTYVPGAGPCFACHETALRNASPAYDDYVRYRAAEPITAPTLGPASCVVGGLIGLELMHVLADQVPATTGTAILVHMRTLDVRREQINRDPDCQACKHLA